MAALLPCPNVRDSDATWRHFGSTDPYFGVLTESAFLSDRLSASSRAEFFRSGQAYVDDLVSTIRTNLEPAFAPTRALDFGCGVGRLTVPLAKVCDEVVGMDISEAMLLEAQRNCADLGISNATFALADDQLSKLSGTFDLLSSLIVFQHIAPRRGEAILRRMLDLLADDGVGALQFTYGFGSSTPRWRRALISAYQSIPLVWNLRNKVKRRPFGEPMMHMNGYDLNRLLRILQEHDCHRACLACTETGFFRQRFYGVIIMFQKRRQDTARFG